MNAMTAPAAAPPAAGRVALRRRLGGLRGAHAPILTTYFCYGASGITGVPPLSFQKDALALTPAEVAGIGFWLGLPWSMKMVAGVASDCYPILGSRRGAYLLLGALAAAGGYAALATLVATRARYPLAMLVI